MANRAQSRESEDRVAKTTNGRAVRVWGMGESPAPRLEMSWPVQLTLFARTGE